MPLKSDAQGFLVGDPVNLIDLAAQWKQVSADTRAIRSMVSRIVNALSVKGESDAQTSPVQRTTKVRERQPQTREKQADTAKPVKHIVEIAQPKESGTANAAKVRSTDTAVATPATKRIDAATKAVSAAVTRAGKEVKEEVEKKASGKRTNEAAAAQAASAVRDAKGRFVGKGGTAEADGFGADRKSSSALAAAAGRLAEAAKEAGEGIGESDPAVQAFQEVAQPLMRGFELLGFGRSAEENWLRKIFRSLTDFRKEETVFNKAQNKQLKEIAEKPQGGIRETGARFVDGAKQLGMGALSFGKAFAKKIPLLGALLAGGSALFDIFKSENDDSKTRAEKDASTGKAAGKGIGALGGMFGGAKLGAIVGSALGPIGTAVGSIVGGAAGFFGGTTAGAVIGEKIGSFVGYLREADIPGKITAIWSGFTDTLKSGWDSALESLANVWDKTKETVGGAVDSANSWVKEKTGVDIIGSIKGAFSKEGVIGSKFVRPESEDYRPGRKQTDPWRLGATSELYESGNRGAGAISSGKGDYGGASYGMYQFSSKQGTVQKFIKDAGYEELFEGKKVGSKEFNETWKNLAKYDPTFAAEQRSFVKREYYDKAQEQLKQRGLDMSGRGRAVQDAIWSTSVQFGAGGAADMMGKALAGKDASKMSDAEIVSALQDYKIANNEKLFRSSSWRVRAGTLNRAESEKKRLVAMANQDASMTSLSTLAAAPKSPVKIPPAAPATVTASAPKLPQTKPAAQASAMARVEQPVGSLGRAAPPVVNVQAEVGQDVKDRNIAHIVTGGIAV